MDISPQIVRITMLITQLIRKLCPASCQSRVISDGLQYSLGIRGFWTVGTELHGLYCYLVVIFHLMIKRIMNEVPVSENTHVE